MLVYRFVAFVIKVYLVIIALAFLAGVLIAAIGGGNG